MKVMELDDLVDSLEEMEEITYSMRFEIRDLLQKILDRYDYKDRETNIEVVI